MKLSVIVCTKNRCELLKNTIKNIIDQTFKDWELIIVEGNSFDETHNMLMDMYDRGAIKYASNNGDYLDARNIGLKIATGEYVTFVDDDDIILRNKFENQINILDANPDISVVSSLTMFNREVGLEFSTQNHTHEDFVNELSQNDIMQIMNFQSCMFRKADIDKLFANNNKNDYFFKEFVSGGAEYVFLYLLYFSGCKFYNIIDTLYLYRLGEEKNALCKSLSFEEYRINIEEKSLEEKKEFITNLYNSYRDYVEEVKPEEVKSEEVKPEEVKLEEKPKRGRKKKEEVVEEVNGEEKPKKKRGRPKKTQE